MRLFGFYLWNLGEFHQNVRMKIREKNLSETISKHLGVP